MGFGPGCPLPYDPSDPNFARANEEMEEFHQKLNATLREIDERNAREMREGGGRGHGSRGHGSRGHGSRGHGSHGHGSRSHGSRSHGGHGGHVHDHGEHDEEDSEGEGSASSEGYMEEPGGPRVHPSHPPRSPNSREPRSNRPRNRERRQGGGRRGHRSSYRDEDDDEEYRRYLDRWLRGETSDGNPMAWTDPRFGGPGGMRPVAMDPRLGGADPRMMFPQNYY